MKFSKQEVLQYVQQENVKFIRLAFCDVFGRQKNIAIMPGELERAFSQGIAIDASAIAGFGGEVQSDLFLHPDPATLVCLPWRPEVGKVVRMFCHITHPDGSPLAGDTRALLKKAVEEATARGIYFDIGAEMEFYLFQTDEKGEPTDVPYDHASYMDIAPQDRGENVRRQVCLTLEEIGIQPECSHHEEGPGQNEVDFRYSDPLTAADDTVAFRTVVQTVAMHSGLYADFTPKPLRDHAGNGFHINISAHSEDGRDLLPAMIAGIMEHISDITLFLNPQEASYQRLGKDKAPRYITWSRQNRSQLIRIPAADAAHQRAEIRSADPTANPYLAFALLIYAALDGIKRELTPPESTDLNLFTAPSRVLSGLRALPTTKQEAINAAKESAFLHQLLPETVLESYCG